MVRSSKLGLVLVVLSLAAAIALAYSGMAASIVSPDQLPGSPVVGAAAILGLIATAAVASSSLDTRAWKRTGQQVGLTPDGKAEFESDDSQQSDAPVLSGRIGGRAVQARSYSTGGGRHSTSTTYTVVETALETPVDWSGGLGIATESETAEDPGVDAAKIRRIDGVGVRGDVPDEFAREFLTVPVRNALATVEGEVSVGDVAQNVIDGMLDELPEDAGGMGALAEGLLNAQHDGEPGPSRTVAYRERGLLTDPTELQTRIDAVTTVARAIDRASAGST